MKKDAEAISDDMAFFFYCAFSHSLGILFRDFILICL